MPTTYSTDLRLALLGNGEDAGTWGNYTNTNLGTLLEQAICGLTSVDVSSGAVTLTTVNGATDQARSAVLAATGTPSTTAIITIPNVNKTYYVNNTTAQSLSIQTSGGSAYTMPASSLALVYCDGSNNVVGPSSSTYSSFTNPLLTGIRETATVSATAATGTINYDYLTQAVLYYTTSAAANWTVNFRGNSSTTLASLLSTGQSVSVTFLVTQGATPYYNTAITIDGASYSPVWQGGIAPTAGNASGIDAYTYAIIKTSSSPTYTVLASLTQFK